MDDTIQRILKSERGNKHTIFGGKNHYFRDHDGKLEYIGSTTSQKQRKALYVRFYKHGQYDMAKLSKSEKALLIDLIPYIQYYNIVKIGLKTRESIAKKNGVTEDAIRKTVEMLMKNGVLFRIETAEYIINPHLLACGTEPEMLKLQAYFNYDGDTGIWTYEKF